MHQSPDATLPTSLTTKDAGTSYIPVFFSAWRAEEKRTTLKNTAQPLFSHCLTIAFPITNLLCFVTNLVMIVTFLL